MRTLRAIAALHLLAWSQTLQVLGGALLPGARPKNRAAKVVRLVERELKPGEKLRGVSVIGSCPECLQDHGGLRHGEYLRELERQDG